MFRMKASRIDDTLENLTTKLVKEAVIQEGRTLTVSNFALLLDLKFSRYISYTILACS